jgi:hypothetical protein
MDRRGRRPASLPSGGAGISHPDKTVGSAETSTQHRNVTTAGWVAAKGSLLGSISDKELQAASEIMKGGGIATPEAVAEKVKGHPDS